MSTSEEELRREFEQAAHILENADPAVLAGLFQGGAAPPRGPRNRHERRALKYLREHPPKVPPKTPPKAPKNAPPKPAATPEVKAADKPRTIYHRELPEFFLQHWQSTRGPLLEDPRAAVCRAIALGVVFNLSNGGARDRSTGVRAARAVKEHMRPCEPSKKPASGAAYAEACALLVDVRRALREGGDVQGNVHMALRSHGPFLDIEAQFELTAWANLLVAAFDTEDENLRLRAARALLRWTGAEARKVGRGERFEEEDEALLADIEARLEGRAPPREAGAPPQRADAPAPGTTAPT